MACRDGAGVRLITRKGNDFSARFPFIARAVAALPARSCLIDGEAIVTNDAGLAVFELIQRQRTSAAAVLCAFDLLELDGEDLRRLPIENRKRQLAKLLKGASPKIVVNEHFDGHGEIVFEQACKLGCEGIVSKRLGSLYRSRRSRHWLKVKNPARRLGAITVLALRSWLLFLGVACSVIVLLTHVFERLHLFPNMGWGLPNSPGHYLDLISAIVGCISLLAAFFLRIVARRRTDAN